MIYKNNNKNERQFTMISTVLDEKISDIPDDYHPPKDDDFMGAKMREYFRQKLLTWRKELTQEYTQAVLNLQDLACNESDPNDRAASEIDMRMTMRSMDRERKLINKIDDALLRIKNGTFGYCEQTDDPIEVARLEARPVATLCFKAQEALERIEKVHRE
jgi:DnaK suppressor protein